MGRFSQMSSVPQYEENSGRLGVRVEGTGANIEATEPHRRQHDPLRISTGKTNRGCHSRNRDLGSRTSVAA